MFTIGPGLAVAGGVSRNLDALRRVIVVLAAGSAATPVLIDLLGRAHLVPANPYVACAFAGAGLAAWRLTSAPHLVLAMVHRFWGVPILSIFFRYGWPTFVSLGALTAFTLVRSLASRGVAVLAVVLLIVGSDLSYLAAWFLPHAAIGWDYLPWPTKFLSPTMQVMHFSTWSPSLPVYFTALFAIMRAVGGEGRLRDVNRFYSSADGNADAALDTLRRYQVTQVIVRPQDDHVHPAVLEKLELILQFPRRRLYEVPWSGFCRSTRQRNQISGLQGVRR